MLPSIDAALTVNEVKMDFAPDHLIILFDFSAQPLHQSWQRAPACAE